MALNLPEIQRRILDPYDQRYVEAWVKETCAWETAGVYDQIAQQIATKSQGGLHLELGVGLGVLIKALLKAVPELRVLGVDRNETFLAEAQERLAAVGLHSRVHSCGTRLQADAGEKRVEVKVQPCTTPHEPLLPKEGCALLVADDFQSMSVVRAVTGGKKADSASYVFPGISSAQLLLGTPLSQWLSVFDDTPSLSRTIADVSGQMRNAAKQQMTDLVRRGGFAHLVERCRVPEGDVMLSLDARLEIAASTLGESWHENWAHAGSARLTPNRLDATSMMPWHVAGSAGGDSVAAEHVPNVELYMWTFRRR